jgi:mannosyltransferase OCH1-like enzyme
MLLQHSSYEDAATQLDELFKEQPPDGAVPKIIHQFWFGLESPNMPESWSSNFEAWSTLHPEWVHVLWSGEESEECVKINEPAFYDTYLNYKYNIQRIDAVRYCMLKRFGGLYVDLDMKPLKPIDPFITCGDSYVMWSAFSPGVYTNALFATTKGASLMDEMITYMTNYIKEWWMIAKFLTVMHTTGPSAFTQVIKVHKENISVLPVTLFNNEYNAKKNEDKVVLNSYGCSWHGFDSVIIKFITIHITSCACIFVFLVCLAIFCAILYSQKFKKCTLKLEECSKSKTKCLLLTKKNKK